MCCHLRCGRYDVFVNNIFLGLGTNLGDRIQNLRRAIDLLGRSIVVKEMSSVYETSPHGVAEQPLYLNMAIRGETTIPPRQLLDFVKAVEEEMGRGVDTHDMPRPIDVDILLYEDRVIEMPELTVPHRKLHERAFVLVPLEEIASFHVHPGLRRPVIDLLDELGGYDDLVWRADEQL